MRPSKPQVPGSTPGGDANDINNLRQEAQQRDTQSATQPATSIFLDLPDRCPRCAVLRARVAELESQHDNAADMFASGRRYERAWAKLRVAELEAQRDAAYTERNRCVAAIVRLALANGWRAGLGRHVVDETPWDPEWLNVVYVDLPAGQASWHVHDGELPLFAGLPAYQGAWDGHTTDEKYARLGQLHRWRSKVSP